MGKKEIVRSERQAVEDVFDFVAADAEIQGAGDRRDSNAMLPWAVTAGGANWDCLERGVFVVVSRAL